MSIQFTDQTNVAMYDSVTGRAFGPTFESEDHAADFMAFVESKLFNIRTIDAETMDNLHSEWFDAHVDGESGALRPAE